MNPMNIAKDEREAFVAGFMCAGGGVDEAHSQAAQFVVLERIHAAETCVAALTDEQRLELFAGYCRGCGRALENGRCHCMNDD